MTCPWWSHVGYHQSPCLYFPSALVGPSGGSTPWSCQAHLWDLTGLQFLGSSFFPFLKMGVMFPLFQLMGTSPDCHDPSNMMDGGLATSCDSSLRTCGWISLGPVNLCTFGFFRWSQTWSSLTASKSTFSICLPLLSATWAVWLESLPVKTVVKHLSWVTQLSPYPFWPSLQFPSRVGPHPP